MSDTQPHRSATIYDSFSVLPDGMNSGESPLLLEKTQAAYLANVTVRDGFATCRPPFTKNLTINYPSAEVQEVIEQGLFQGALPEMYRPDAGAPSQIAQISGRLFQFQLVGDVFTVTEITIPGDPNPATATQAWLWQAENFVIVQDGISLPIFWDGVTSRRSQGVTQIVGTIIAPFQPVPDPGDPVTVTLSAPYTGLFNTNVLIDGVYYTAVENGGGYLVDAVSLYDIPGDPIAIGTQVVAKPSVAFVLGAPNTTTGPHVFNTLLSLTTTTPYTGTIFLQVLLFGKLWQIWTVVGNTLTLRSLSNGTMTALPAGTQVSFSSSTAPNVIYGTVTTAAVAPAVGGSVQLLLSNAYSGAAGQVVFIGDRQYAITAIPSAPGSSTLTLINVDAPTGGDVGDTDPEIWSVPELPAGRMGAYGHAQNWTCLVDGISFICSDISGSPSGTPAYQYRDAVLKTTEITFGGGNFRIPSAGETINSMSFATRLDASMGQGALMIGTEQHIFSCVAPVDPENIADIVLKGSPILTYALIGRGPLAQNSTINVNSDLQFRSTVGLGSLVIARQQFTSSLSGNTPISEEMIRVLSKDDPQLLPYSSAINFDNRVIFTASPQASSQGVFHSSMVVMNLDGLSRLRGQEQAAYDGQWSGINTLQLTRGLVNGVPRAFAFTFNVSLSKIEIYELLPTGGLHFDNGSVPITWGLETAALFNEDVKPKNVLVQLQGGEFAVDSVVGTVRFQVFYKPDQYGGVGELSCWVPWHDFTICAAAGSKPLYFPRLGLPEPQAVGCNGQLDIPLRLGYTFQVRFVITGMCRLLRARFSAVTQPIPKFAPPICNVTETVAV